MLEITNSVGTYSNQLCIAMGEELVCTLCIPSTLCTALNLPYLLSSTCTSTSLLLHLFNED